MIEAYSSVGLTNDNVQYDLIGLQVLGICWCYVLRKIRMLLAFLVTAPT